MSRCPSLSCRLDLHHVILKAVAAATAAAAAYLCMQTHAPYKAKRIDKETQDHMRKGKG
jgi:hypothetical protein